MFQNDNIRGALFKLLAERGSSDAASLHSVVSHQQQHPCSIQAIYKELRYLLEEGIIIKAGKEYALSYRWIVNSLEFLDGCYERYMEQQRLAEILPREGEKNSWKFTSFKRTDDFWVQGILAVLKESKVKQALMWIPHAWFELIHHEKDMQFQAALRASGYKIVMAIGGTTWLDQRCARDWPPDVYKYTLVDKLSPFGRERSILLCEDFYLEVKLDAESAQMIDDLYAKSGPESNMRIGQFMDVFETPIKATITIDRRKNKTTRLKRTLCEFFGLRPQDF